MALSRKSFYIAMVGATFFLSFAGSNAQDTVKQDTCSQPKFRRLSIMGFRLFMRKADFEKVVPGAEWVYRPETNTSIARWPKMTPPASPFDPRPVPRTLPSGVESVEAKFFGDQLLGFRIEYTRKPKSVGIKDLTEALSKEFDVPVRHWKFFDLGADLTCDIDLLEVSNPHEGRISLSLESYEYYGMVRDYKAARTKTDRKH